MSSRTPSEESSRRLDADPFDWRVTKSGQVLVSRGGRLVVTLAGRDADRLLTRLDAASEAEAQLLLARATGNYRRGNER